MNHSIENKISHFRDELLKELSGNILPYWRQKTLDPSGGFFGRISGNDIVDKDAHKGAIMTSRVLWTFSSAYRILGGQELLDVAEHAKNEIINRFYDYEYGGVYWSIDHEGRPFDTKKQTYAIAFAIYGLSEFYRASGDKKALDYAVKLFNSIETFCRDKYRNGYFEAFSRDWKPLNDMRLSEKDENECKSMNTHLHVLEAYTNLYRASMEKAVGKSLINLLDIFEKYIIGKDGHLKLFFNQKWECAYDIISYGHEIEASWLLQEASAIVEENKIKKNIEPLVKKLASAAGEGYRLGEGMSYERYGGQGPFDYDRHWWVQAESVVGYFNLWQSFADEEALEKALEIWKFIKENLIDRKNGEWFWSVKADGSINREDDKAGFWKCPYHNGRMCLEIIERIRKP